MANAARSKESIVKKMVELEWLESLPSGDFSYEDYESWPEDFRVELDDGMPYMMSSGDAWHSWMIIELGGQLRNHLLGKKCTPYAEYDVRLFYEQDKSDKTVYRPDLMVVCDEIKTKGQKNCQGAPDFVIEIISEHSQDRDLGRKKRMYEKALVKEYWVVGPDKLYKFILEGSKYKETVLDITRDLKQPVSCLEGCIIDFQYAADRSQL